FQAEAHTQLHVPDDPFHLLQGESMADQTSSLGSGVIDEVSSVFLWADAWGSFSAHSSATANTAFEVTFRLDEPQNYLFTHSYFDNQRAVFRHTEELVDGTGQKIDLRIDQIGTLSAGQYTLRNSISAS